MAKTKKSFNAADGLFSERPPAAEPAPPVDGSLLGTQGRKGLRLPRINMGFTPANHEFVRRASRMRGQSMTEFVNTLIDDERERSGWDPGNAGR
jgi:hypothetical protein